MWGQDTHGLPPLVGPLPPAAAVGERHRPHAPLLLWSGIGPARSLWSAGVRRVVDLPVGEGVLAVSVDLVVGAYDGVPLAVVNSATLLADPATLRRWRAGGGGPLGVAPSTGLGRVAEGDGAYFFSSFASFAEPSRPLFTAGCLPNPTSRSRLSLPAGVAAADPFAPPRVETNLLGRRRDVATLLSCMRSLRAMVGDGAWRRHPADGRAGAPLRNVWNAPGRRAQRWPRPRRDAAHQGGGQPLGGGRVGDAGHAAVGGAHVVSVLARRACCRGPHPPVPGAWRAGVGMRVGRGWTRPERDGCALLGALANG